MTATQVLAPTTVADEIRNVLSACRHQRNAADYASRLVQTLAEVTHSQHAMWLNWPANPVCVVAQTAGLNPLGEYLIANERLRVLANDRSTADGIRSVAAAPVWFRSLVVGVLAVANGDEPYTPAHVELLEGIGRVAVAENESLQCAEALGLSEEQRLVDMVHGLRQPLGIMEACAFLLDMSLTPSQIRAREHLQEMLRQLHRASGILDQSAASYASRGSRTDDTEPEESDSFVLTNSAMSMVT
jgi:GAF domain-containing protein